MSASRQMVIRDPSKFHLLATNVKLDIIQAGRDTVNIMAAQGSKEAKQNIKNNFNNRNNFTVRNVGFTQMRDSKCMKISEIKSSVGIDERASYMQRQEEGGSRKPRQGSMLAIPTDAARGGSFRRQVQRGMKVRDIRKRKSRVRGESSARLPQYRGKGNDVPRNRKITTHSRKSNLVSRAYIAHKHNLFLPMGGSGGNRNIFRVTSFRTIGKGRDRRVEFQAKQIYNFERRRTHTRATPWLMPATERVAKNAQRIFNSQMRKRGL